MTASDLAFWEGKVAELWGICGQLKPLPGEFDQNFRLEAETPAVIKVMRPDASKEFVDLQIAALSHLANADDIGGVVPRVLPDLHGNLSQAASGLDGSRRLVWATSVLPGVAFGNLRYKSIDLIHDIGRKLGALDSNLKDFDDPGLDRDMKWDLRRSLWVNEHVDLIEDPARRSLYRRLLDNFSSTTLTQLQGLPVQAIHNDLSDHNILVQHDREGAQSVSGIIDFGDMIRAPAVCDLAIAGAYVLLGQSRPLHALAALVKGYVQNRPLYETECEILWSLVLIRLVVSSINAAMMRQERPDDPYVVVSQAPIEAFFSNQFPNIATPFAVAKLREAAGHHPVPARRCMEINQRRATASIFPDFDLSTFRQLDVSVTGRDAPPDPMSMDRIDDPSLLTWIEERLHQSLGGYGEPRLIYAAPEFFEGPHPASPRRTVHLGIDVFLPAGTWVHAPLDGVVHSAEICTETQGYGGVVVLRHDLAGGQPLFSLYGHLAHKEVAALSAGQRVRAGDPFARLGDWEENGNWLPHLHLQLGVFEMSGAEWPGVADPDDMPVWLALCPDPAPLLGLSPGSGSHRHIDTETLAERRAAHTPSNVRLSYHDPLTLVRGWKCLLFDDMGRTYLDAYNNVPHVGHAHPRISAVFDRQSRLLNTNTRYLQTVHVEYIEALASRFPEPLDVVLLLNSASEANDVALRIMRTVTGAQATIVAAAGYHGITAASLAVSDYKFSGPDGAGRPQGVHVAPIPDTFRGAFKKDDPQAGKKYADHVADIIAKIENESRPVAGFIAESFPSVGGQIVPPPGYLEHVYTHVRRAGGLCIADEVQTGLGRLGAFQWGFEQQGVVPDMVVLGKPIGNGQPLAAIVTTREIAEAFSSRMEFFSTFGGSTLSCAIGHEVLRILDEERLAENAAAVGGKVLRELAAMAENIPQIGDVRGLGLFIGVELIDAAGEPCEPMATYVINRLRERLILIGSDGPNHNILKIRPPMCFSEADADHLISVLYDVLQEDALRFMAH